MKNNGSNDMYGMYSFYKDLNENNKELFKGGNFMRQAKNKFTLTMNGFNIEEVDNYIENLESDQDAKLTDVILRLDEVAQENEALTKKLNDLKSELAQKSQSEELMQYAIKKASEWAELFSQNAAKKAAELERVGKEQEISLNKKIEAYNKALKSSTEKLSFLLSLELEKDNNLFETATDPVDSSTTEGVKNSDGSIVPNFFDVNIEKEASEEKASDVSLEVDNKEIINQASEEKKEHNATEPAEENINVNNVPDEAEVVAFKESKTKGKFDNMFLEITFEEKNALVKGMSSNSDSMETEEDVEDEVGAQQNLSENNEDDDNNGDGDIENIRRKYIVGKIAGEDLHDGSGNIIIRKDNIISMETVAAAEREGKLASLIVDMKIPEEY
ncbi:MAG: hypothetical protein AB6733_13160 [Clostridiaceae bacterium]